MSFTFTTLKSAIQDYVQNDETVFLSQLPLFIRMTEERILKNIQLSLFQKNVGGNFSSGNKYLALPADFLAPISLSATNSSDIVFLDFGPIFEEWEADYGRTYVLGNDSLKKKLANDIEIAWRKANIF